MASGSLRSWTRRVATQPRLLLAAKTAFAAALAWFLAPYLPFTDSHYSYYAPLGAVISMYPTIVHSLRSGMQALLALAIGAGLAFAVIWIPIPHVASLAIIVGSGVLLAGWRALGDSGNWVPITGLFVLLIGGVDADKYSSNYLVHVLFGVVVGLAVNLLLLPPLYTRRAADRLNNLRDIVARHLREMAAAFTEDDPEQREWSRALARIEQTAHDVREAVQQADEARRGNPRGRGVNEQIDEDYQRLRALERVLFFVRDLTDVLGGFRETTMVRFPVRIEVRTELGEAILRVADLVAAAIGSDDGAERLAAAEQAIDRLNSSLDERADGPPSTVADSVTASLALRRIIDASRPFVQNRE